MENAKVASSYLAQLNTTQKNEILIKMADNLEENSEKIIIANSIDLKNAQIKPNEKDRLLLTSSRIKSIANDIRLVANLTDPIGEEEGWSVKNGLKIRKVRVPFGVIAAIYESRPNVTADIASLCIKSSNACILRGSASALNSNRAILDAISSAIPKNSVQLIDSTDRMAVEILMKARGKIDLLIPRGGAELIKRVTENSTVPVIETGTGNCHIFVDESADLEMAENIIINAKCQRPSVCNATEKLIVHEKIAKDFLPLITKKLLNQGVEIRGCEKTLKILNNMKAATDEDWPKEYLDLIIGVKVVSDIDEAIAHINKFNSKHTESIITKNYENSQKFLSLIDAAVVMVNASTRFTDGGQFGFGAEVGISTQKLHARGPMGLRELTCSKYQVFGSGQIRL